jgi:mitotic spindle assembly checkpoint protein MAD2B
VDKVVVVIKDRMDAPLERFVFSIRKMIDVEAYGKDDQ